MHRRAFRVLICLLGLLCCGHFVLLAQAHAQADIYEHFPGIWVGTVSSISMKNGTRQEVSVRMTITEKKKKKGLRMDYVKGQKGTGGFERGTTFLELNPSKATISIWQGDISGEDIYEAIGLNEFVKSGFGKFEGLRRTSADDQFPITHFAFVLTKDTLSYKWEMGADGNHMKTTSIYTLTRVPDTTD
jgi:hypothetical protein